MPGPRNLLCLTLLLLAACNNLPEPHERPGTWRATGANDANLRAMAANPGDLERGAAPAAPARGETGAFAAQRLAVPSGAPGGSAGAAGGSGQGGSGQAGGSARANPGGIPALPPAMGSGNARR